MDKFIKTKDKETADKLLSAGLFLISNNNKEWVFVNNAKANFVKKDKVQITNTLFG